jgi:hypothetical protein
MKSRSISRYYYMCVFSLLAAGIHSSCGSIPPLAEKDAVNFSKTGFLDHHRFQVVVKAEPATHTRGLVEKRDSANIKARNKLRETCITALEEYIYNKNPDLPRPAPKLREQILPYLAYGEIYTEFYTKQHHAILIYRIEKKNLLHSLTTIQQGIKKGDDSEKHTSE